MVDPVEILWTPAGQNLPSLGSKALLDVPAGATPNIRMPVRMLPVDTPALPTHSTCVPARAAPPLPHAAARLAHGRDRVVARVRASMLS